MMDGWGHYGDFALEFTFIYVMIAWNLLALDAVQQWHKLKRKREERKQWE